MRAFLWCNGDLPSLDSINSLGDITPLFGVDGGTIKAISCGFPVIEALGDLDSIGNRDFNGKKTLLPNDSASDLSKTILELSERGYSDFEIVGIDGGAPGHILGIWGSLAESPLQLKIKLHHNNSTTYRITSENNEFQVHMDKNQLFSVFALSTCKRIMIKGAKWELEDEILNLSTKGLHNIANGGILSINTDGIIVLIIEN